TVRAEVDELPPGEYTAGYRVTSADGHVVSGSATFTVGGADGSTQDDATRDAPDQVAEEDDESDLAPALWGGGGLAVLLVVAGFFPLRRGDGPGARTRSAAGQDPHRVGGRREHRLPPVAGQERRPAEVHHALRGHGLRLGVLEQAFLAVAAAHARGAHAA